MSKKLVTGIVIVLAVLVVGLFFLSEFINTFHMSQTPSQVPNTPQGNAGLVVQDVSVGTGQAAAPGDTVTVNYTGKFQDGTVFDTSVGKAPFLFTVGEGKVIQGWDQGIVGMKEGGKRILIVPPELGYGTQTYGPIPGNSTLTFEIDLIKVQHPSQTAPLPEGSAAQ